MQQLPPIYRGDPFYFTGTYKSAGIPTAITEDVILSATVCSKHGTTALSLVANPDQVNNIGQFVLSTSDTKCWHDQAFLTISMTVLGIVNPPARATIRVLEVPCPTSHCR